MKQLIIKDIKPLIRKFGGSDFKCMLCNDHQAMVHLFCELWHGDGNIKINVCACTRCAKLEEAAILAMMPEGE